MNYSIPVGDLMLFIVFCMAAVVTVFLVIMMINLINLIKRAIKIIDSNSENLSKTLAILPETVKNVNDVTVGLKENMEKAGVFIENIEDAVTGTVVSVSESTEGFMDIAKTAMSVFKMVVSFFSKNKD
jgi:predicted PurR-regulated permease PerM